ncbi:6-phosphofructokinase, partial [Ruminococcaceae bacterium OttesenSCG-928-L11]|nr:6-phosphofructokinase [Ruminococcaceae bacterium OttesenSCG-928-L11]
MKNLMIAQSGGPTVAINSTLAGIVERALTGGEIPHVYGARFGIKGLLNDDVIEIGGMLSDPDALKRLIHTPSSALGSCRVKLGGPDTAAREYETILRTLEKYDIGYFIYIGGNDSMDTVAKLSDYIKDKGIQGLSIMGAPKTIDNDLCGMDHSPGFGSAAKYIATTFTELWCDCGVYDIPAVTIVEVMGRHVGWLTASAALANTGEEGAPQLIYLPEIAFEKEKFIADVRRELARNPAVLIAVSEGIHYADGTFVSEGENTVTDVFGHKYLSGAARVLEDMVRTEIGCKARSIDLSLMQRCAGHLAASNDLTEAKLLGATALDRALKGESGKVSVITRISDSPYRVKYETVCAKEIANKEKAIPREWINAEGNFITEEMYTYLRPLVHGHFGNHSGDNSLPRHYH